MTSTCAIVAACGVALLCFVLVAGLVWFLRRNWTHVAFSPHKVVHNRTTDKFEVTDAEVDFEPRLGHYLKTAEVVITLASASLVFVPRLVISNHPEWFAFSMTLFGLCVMFLVLFMVLLLYFYEDSLYFPTFYTVFKSALVVSTGVTGLICFLLAYLSIAIQIAKAVGDKAVVLR